MSTTVTVVIAAVAFVALVLILALLMKKQHYAKCEININAPHEQVFDYVKLIKNQDTFNKHAAAGSDRDKKFTGTDGTVGFIYAWSGDKNAGVGEKEITNIVDGKRVETEIRFTKPMAVSAVMVMETVPLSVSQTKVSWSNSGTLKFPLNIMIPMMEKSVAKDMNSSLLTLKKILENNSDT